MTALDNFWKSYADCATELTGATTVDQVIETCNKHFDKSSGDAFFPGGSGDIEVLPILIEAGWKPVWVQAYYYWAARQPNDVCKICHEPIELDHNDDGVAANKWIHSHADKDQYCGTGDGSTAIPQGIDGLTYVEGDIYRGIQKPI